MYLNSLNELKTYVKDLCVKPEEELMILTGEKSSSDVDELISYLNEEKVKFFGGIYSRLLVRNQSLKEGFIVQKYEPIYSSMVLPFLMRFKLDPKTIENCTALVLVDGLSSKMTDLTDTIYNKLTSKVNYVGGGAGYYDLIQRPCIFTNDGIFKDVSYVCIVKSPVKLAVSHGWNKLEGPFHITESNENILSKLDEYNAFDVYRDVIEDEEKITLCKSDFFTYAKDHPFGIIKKGQTNIVVRDPISLTENNEIVCVADIPQGSKLYILKGDVNSLLSSSLDTAINCASNAPEKYTPLLFDCISRAMFLENRFEEELDNIQSKLKYSVEGALSIGEISSNQNSELVIHNKSTILGLLSTEN